MLGHAVFRYICIPSLFLVIVTKVKEPTIHESGLHDLAETLLSYVKKFDRFDAQAPEHRHVIAQVSVHVL